MKLGRRRRRQVWCWLRACFQWHRKYLYTRCNMLIEKFKSCSDNVKKCPITMLCNIVYSGHLWTVYRSQALKKVKCAFNDIYQNLFSVERGASMSTIYVHNNVDCFNMLLRKAAYKFRLCLVESTNSYVKLITKSVYFYCNLSYLHLWEQIKSYYFS